MMTKYQKFLRDNQVALQGLVGSFDEKDKYTIKKEIVDEIISAKKLLLTYKEYDATCELYTKEKTYKLKFIFTLDEKSGKRYANLYLLEQLDLFGEKNELKTFLACYSAIDDFEYLDKLKKVFNLFTKDESEGKDIKNDTEFDKKAKQNAQKKKILSNSMWYCDKKYVLDSLKVLKSSGQSGLDIIKLLNKSLLQLKLNKNSPEFWIQAKIILDEIMSKNQNKLPESSQKYFDVLNNRYIDLYNASEHSVVLPSEKSSSNGGQKKSASAKKSGGGKSSDSKKSGGGAKKDDKKKSDSGKQSAKPSGKNSVKPETKSSNTYKSQSNTNGINTNFGEYYQKESDSSKKELSSDTKFKNPQILSSDAANLMDNAANLMDRKENELEY